MKILLLEDSKRRIRKIKEQEEAKGNTVDVVYNPLQMMIQTFWNDYDKLILDHDLQGRIFMSSRNVYSGLTALMWSYEFINAKEILIHSWNPWGAFNMWRFLKKLGFKNIKYRPCRWPI
jgi:hypothetical protein